ncbi:MAG: acetolactate synthase large subunit [Syntrophorhabdaceae bacterium]|nr:acetolactate synthase large subunit [Syntrophorhabdaceae bacterium]
MKDKKIESGAEAVIKALYDADIKVCFANAGTTEIPLLLAMDNFYPEMKTFLCLFEGVCTGAADGYGRMRERPAMTLLHLGPGFANGIANLHNAKRANTPILNIIGEHATWHIKADPPLNMDIESLVKTVSHWYRTNRDPKHLLKDTEDAIKEAFNNKIATLIIPHNHQIEKIAYGVSKRTTEVVYEPLDLDLIEFISERIKKSKRIALFLGGKALRKNGLEIVSRIQRKTGCAILTETFPGYIDRGGGLPYVEKIPYFPDEAKKLLEKYEMFIIAGTREPVTFFGYEGIDSYLFNEGQEKLYLCNERQDVCKALHYLADALGSYDYKKNTMKKQKTIKDLKSNLPTGTLTPEKISYIVAAFQPEDAIVVDEGLTSFFAYYPMSAIAPPHTLLTITGGSIGYGMPCAIGAAIACPERTVINVEADGSAMYTVQSLWTQAHESLNIKTLICSNRSYNILKIELARANVTSPGKNSLSSIEIDNPEINWVSLARGFGIQGASVEDAEDLATELEKAINTQGPYLIEMKL